MKNFNLLLCALLAVTSVAFLGCNKDKGYKAVTGTVTMDGAPVEGATVTFYNQDSTGEPGGGKTDATGAYTVTSSGASNGGKGLLPGTYKVTVMKYEEVVDPDQEAFDKGEIDYDELQKRKGKTMSGTRTGGAPKLLTPAQYANPGGTPLSVTVSTNPQENVFDFNLE